MLFGFVHLGLFVFEVDYFVYESIVYLGKLQCSFSSVKTDILRLHIKSAIYILLIGKRFL